MRWFVLSSMVIQAIVMLHRSVNSESGHDAASSMGACGIRCVIAYWFYFESGLFA